ncbi:MAG: 50S ribosomal protein L21 [Candidatus Brocadiia bacterium]
MQYAIVRNRSEQFKVVEGAKITLQKIDAKDGEEIVFNDILLYANDSDIRVGKPLVSGVKVVGVITSQLKGPKVVTMKFRRREGYKKKTGHRQKYTIVKINKIEAV